MGIKPGLRSDRHRAPDPPNPAALPPRPAAPPPGSPRAHSGGTPIGRTVQASEAEYARRSRAYRNARDEYAHINKLRQTNPIAAHLRERRFELGLTQHEVATAAHTSHTAISRLENGTHLPQLPTLHRITAVLGEELLLCFQTTDGEAEPTYATIPTQ